MLRMTWRTALAFVACEIVEDDDVAGLEGWDEFSARPRPGSSECSWGRRRRKGAADPVCAQGGEEGHGAPVAMRAHSPSGAVLAAPSP